MTDWLHEVAAHLSDLAHVEWRVDVHTPRERWYLRRVRIDGGVLFVSPPLGYGARMQRETHRTFAARWPTHPVSRLECRPRRIVNGRFVDVDLHRTVRIDRAPLSIAREVYRHVLVPYEPLYSEQWGQWQQDTRRVREASEFAAELAAMGGALLSRHSQPTVLIDRVEFGVCQSGDVEIRDSRVTREQARRIAEVLRG